MSLVPARQNFTIYQGATFFKRIFYKLEGELQDLTGYSAELIIKDKPQKNVLLTLSTSEGGIELGGAAGTIDIEITDDETKLLTWKTGVYELFLTDTASRTDVLLFGGFKVVLF